MPEHLNLIASQKLETIFDIFQQKRYKLSQKSINSQPHNYTYK